MRTSAGLRTASDQTPVNDETVPVSEHGKVPVMSGTGKTLEVRGIDRQKGWRSVVQEDGCIARKLADEPVVASGKNGAESIPPGTSMTGPPAIRNGICANRAKSHQKSA